MGIVKHDSFQRQGKLNLGNVNDVSQYFVDFKMTYLVLRDLFADIKVRVGLVVVDDNHDAAVLSHVEHFVPQRGMTHIREHGVNEPGKKSHF